MAANIYLRRMSIIFQILNHDQFFLALIYLYGSNT